MELKCSFPFIFLFESKRKFIDFEEGLIEGSLKLTIFSSSQSAFISDINKRKSEFSILRFINEDSNGNAIINYKIENSQETNNDIIHLSNKNIDRCKFKHLYIEKLVNVKNNNIVEIGDIIIYKIIIKNLNKNDYNDELIIKEFLSKYVTFESYNEHKDNISSDFDMENKKLEWNIGKLKKGER